MAKIIPVASGSFPPPESAKLANEFAVLASQDARAAKLLYRSRLYGLSAFHVQQAVEKATKAVGLLMGLVEPKDIIANVGHNSLNAVIISLADYLQSVVDQWDESERKAKEAPDFGRGVAMMDLLVGAIKERIVKDSKTPEEARTRENQVKSILTMSEILAKTKADVEKVRPQIEPLRKQLEVFRALAKDQRGFVWKSTMGFQENQGIDTVVALLRKRSFEASIELRDLRKLKSVRRGKDMSSYLYPVYLSYVHRIAFSMSLNIAALVLGHEEPTRYPPLRPGDFWAFNPYSPESKMVKLLPELIQWKRTYCEATLEGSKAVMSHYAKTERG